MVPIKGLIPVLFFAICSSLSVAQEIDYKVYDQNTETLLYNYFMKRLQVRFDTRRTEVTKALESEEALLERRDLLRSRYQLMIGELPTKTPLNPVINQTYEFPDYSVEAVAFESRPNHHVTGLFYLPKKGEGPFPAVYIPCGHSTNGKANESYQKAARLFALNGFAVLQADPVSQGERFQLLNDEGLPKTGGGTLMHEFFGQALALTGSSTLEYALFDNIRCIDFLMQHPSVDKGKIAVAGNSGGGTQATYLLGYDERIVVGTPSCFIATKEEKMRTHGIGDFCQHMWAEGKYGIEEQDFLFMAAPKPIKILSMSEDFFVIEGAKNAYQELLKEYSKLGVIDKIEHGIADGPHGWSKPNRVASVEWCKKWLLDETNPVVEPEDIGMFTDQECQASPTGQVLTSFKNEKSTFDIIRDRTLVCRENREAFLSMNNFKEVKSQMKELLGFEKPSNNPYSKSVEVINKGEFTIEKILIERDVNNNFFLPALLLSPKVISKKSRKAIIILDSKGKTNSIEKAIQEVEKGLIVLLVDISDTGEIKDNRKFRASWSQYFTAKFPLYEGKTLIGYQTEDILIAQQFLFSRFPKINNIKLISNGNTGYAALHASLFSSQIDGIELSSSLVSWEEMANEMFESNNQLARMDVIIPDVLNFYDIPDLEKFCKKRNIEVVIK